MKLTEQLSAQGLISIAIENSSLRATGWTTLAWRGAMVVRIAVFGSLNYDLTLWVPHMPGADETLLASRMEAFAGGKGANQAVAAARSGGRVSMIGSVGKDDRGRFLLDGLVADGVDIAHVTRVDEPTGTAFPIVSPNDVSIIIVRGANGTVGTSNAQTAADVLAAADVLLLQGEVPADGAGEAARLARAAGTKVVFNPAPVSDDIVAAVLPHTDVLIVNRQEKEQVQIPEGLTTVVTLGAEGALVEGQILTAFPVETVVDPTGAGDAFCASLAVGLAEGMTLPVATRMGMAAGALAVQTAGAQPSLPTRAAIDTLLGS